MAFTLWSAGCAGQGAIRRLDAAALARSAPSSVAVAVSDSPPFVMASAPQFLPIPGGTLAALSTTTALGIQQAGRAAKLRGAVALDPAEMSGAFVVDALKQQLNLQVQPDPSAADLLVQLRTLKWGLLANRENALWLQYEGTLRLLDRRTGAVLAEGSCSNPPPRSDTEQPPVYMAWVFEDGALLKQELWKIANRCADEYITRVLALRGAPPGASRSMASSAPRSDRAEGTHNDP